MLVTDDARIAALARSLRNQGRDSMTSVPEHRRLGYNYRMGEMSAALGLRDARWASLDGFVGQMTREIIGQAIGGFVAAAAVLFKTLHDDNVEITAHAL